MKQVINNCDKILTPRTLMQVTVKHRMMNNLSSTCRDVIGRPGPDQDHMSRELSLKVDELRKRWQAILAELTAQRDKIAASISPAKDSVRGAQEAAQACLDRVAYLLTSAANPSDDTSLSVRLSMVKVGCFLANIVTCVDVRSFIPRSVEESCTSSYCVG